MGALLPNKVSDFIVRHQLLSHGSKYLLALSGGADSVALLLVTKELGYDIEAVHCNFHLRGEEADRDEQFCKHFCKQQGVPLHLVHFDTRFYADTHKVSIEMAARNLRYSHFERLMSDIGAQGILVAHHQDDSVETVLLNLIRGTGLHGLKGISPINGHIIRPLLGLTRQEIEAFLKERKQDYVTDSSNLTADVVRNKIRLEVLPLLRTINPSVSDSIALTANRLSQVAKIFDEAIHQKIKAASIPAGDSESQAYSVSKIDDEYVLFEILKPLSFSPAQITDIYQHLDAETGTLFASATHEVLLDRGRMLIQPQKEPFKPMRLPMAGRYVLPSGQKLVIEEQVVDDDFQISKKPDTACLDAEKVKFPLLLRTVREGDRFQPLGMRGSRLVSDFLTDLKYSLFQKRRQLVIEDATGHIVWLVGLRPSHPYRITPKTRKAIMITSPHPSPKGRESE